MGVGDLGQAQRPRQPRRPGRAQGLPDDSRQYDAHRLSAPRISAEEARLGRPARARLRGRGAERRRHAQDLRAVGPPCGHRDVPAVANSRRARSRRTGGMRSPRTGRRSSAPRASICSRREIRDLIDMARRADRHPSGSSRLAEVMALANEQAEWNRRTRDLIAAARPTPGRGHRFHPERHGAAVASRHRRGRWTQRSDCTTRSQHASTTGTAVFAGERRRLMWIGRGLWSDLEMYRLVPGGVRRGLRLVDVPRDRRGRLCAIRRRSGPRARRAVRGADRPALRAADVARAGT